MTSCSSPSDLPAPAGRGDLRPFVLDSAASARVGGTLEFHDLLVLARRLVATRTRHPPPAPRPLPPDPARRVPGHRPDPARDRRAAHGRIPTIPRTTPTGGSSPGARPPVHRRRPEAVDLPLPAGRHRPVPAGRRSGRRRPSHADRQLPLIGSRHRLRQRRVRPADRRADRRPARLRPARRVPSPLRDHGTVPVLGAEASTTSTRLGGDAQPTRCVARPRRRRCRRHRARRRLAGRGRGRAAEALRPCLPGDITVLLPTRISLPALEAELRDARRPVPGREQLGRLHHRRDPPSAAGAAGRRRSHRPARARRRAAHPAVRLQRRRALRVGTAAAGGTCGRRRRRRSPAIRSPRPSPTSAPSPSGSHGGRPPICSRRSSTSAGSSTLALDGPDARDVWRRLRYVIEQARAWADAGGHGSRRYLPGRGCRRPRAASPTRFFPSTTTTPSAS